MLNIKDGAQSKSYLTTSQCDKPRLCVDNGGYIPLTTNTISGIQIKNRINGQTYRPMEYKSSSTIDTFYTSAAESIGLSSTTALTRESISGYATRASTSATLTRASTSATLTRASTSATLTRASTSATLTRASTSATLTRASTSATLTRASTSATLTRSSVSGYKTKVNYTETFFEENRTTQKHTYYISSGGGEARTKMPVRDLQSYYSGGQYLYSLTPGWTKFGNSISAETSKKIRFDYFLSTGGRKYMSASSYFLDKQSTGPYHTGSASVYQYTSYTFNRTSTGNTYSSKDWLQGIWPVWIFPVFTGIPAGIKSIGRGPNNADTAYLISSSSNATETIFAFSYYSNSWICETLRTATYASGNTVTTATLTRSSVSGYKTRSSISGYETRSSVSGYGTKSSVSGYGTRSSVSGYGTRSSISGYATRSSISGYETRISTSATLTCESTSGYSGISSSSSSTEVWQ